MSAADQPTRGRYLVLGVLCSLAFLTYLDRICIMRVQGDIVTALNFTELTAEDERRLQVAAAQGYRPEAPGDRILTVEDEARLERDGQGRNLEARREATIKRLEDNRSTERMSWVFTAFLFGYMLFEIPGGWLGDKWGPRLVIVRIVIWWSVFTALTGSVDTLVRLFTSNPAPMTLLAAMVVTRFLFGIGEAGAYPNIARALARWLPFRERALGQGAIWMCSRFGGAFSPTIIGFLMVAVGGWRQAFWVLGGLGIVWAIFFARWYRNRPEEMPSVNAAECALIKGEGGAIYHDSHDLRGAPWKKLFTSTNLWAVYITASAVSFSWYINVTFLPRYLKEQFSVDYSNSEIMSGLPLFVSAFFCLAGGALSDYLVRRLGSRRWGRSLPGVIGFAIAGVCLTLIPQANSPWVAIALICTACAVQDLAIPAIWAVSADVGGRYAGTLAGTMNAMGGIGAMLSPLLAAKMRIAYDWNTVWVMFAGSYFLGSLMWIRINAAETIDSEQPAA